MARLTKRKIDTAKYAGGWDVRWDGEVTGLGLRIYPSGRKSFVLSYRHKGRKRLMVLGRYGTDLTLDQARSLARANLSKIKIKEIDPLVERARARKAQTFVELWADYLTGHAKPNKKTWVEDEKRFYRHIPASWHGRKITDVSKSDVRKLHASIAETGPYEANRVLALLSKMFTFAANTDIVPAGFPNPVRGIERRKEYKRKRYLTPTELPKLIKAIDQEPNVYIRAAIWLFMLTGARRGELLPRRWAEIDFDEARLNLPETKSGEAQFIPLSKPALAILKGIPKAKENPFVLPGAIKGRHLVNISKPWLRIRKSAGLSDLRLHDLRRTVGSWLSQAGVDLNTIKEGLRHSNLETTLIYARLADDPARDAFEQHGADLIRKAGGPVRLVSE